MPNWCEGTLKVRGNKENVKRFILEGLKPVDSFGEELEPLKVNEFGAIEYDKSCWIKNTTRGFAKNIDVYPDYDSDIVIEAFDTKFAWNINPDELLAACKEFNVDMKIHAFECGMEFNQVIEIIDGRITKDEVLHFDDYQWECICPTMGG